MSYVRLYNWYVIPEEIKADRTFVQNHIYALYIENMDNFPRLISGKEFSTVSGDLPLFYLKESLFQRRWNMFGLKRHAIAAFEQ